MTINPRYKVFAAYIITFIASLCFSYIAINSDNFINHDAVFYMDASKVFLRDGAIASFNSYSWPFYSWLIALSHNILFFSEIEQTAHFINALFLAFVCILFIHIYIEITNNKGSAWVAAIIILSFSGINSFRADIMRDIPFWFLYLAGFYCLLLYYKRPRWITCVGWQVFVGLAFLARVEGLILILLGPLAIFLKQASIKERLVRAGALYSLYTIFLLVGVVIYFLFDSPNHNIPIGKLRLALGFINGDGIIGIYDAAVREVGELYDYEGQHIDKNYWVLAVVHAFGLLAYVTVRVMGCLGWLYSVVISYGVFKGRIPASEYNKIILYFISFLFIFFCVYMLKGAVLTPRYTTPLVFMLLLLAGQIVERLIPRIMVSKHSRKVIAAGFLYLLLATADSLITTQGDSKNYVINAGHWVRENVDRNTPVFSNYLKALYYTDRMRSKFDSMRFELLLKRINTGRISKGSYVMVEIEHNDEEGVGPILDQLIADNKIKRVNRFENKKGDKIIIFMVLNVRTNN